MCFHRSIKSRKRKGIPGTSGIQLKEELAGSFQELQLFPIDLRTAAVGVRMVFSDAFMVMPPDSPGGQIRKGAIISHRKAQNAAGSPDLSRLAGATPEDIFSEAGMDGIVIHAVPGGRTDLGLGGGICKGILLNQNGAER